MKQCLLKLKARLHHPHPRIEMFRNPAAAAASSETHPRSPPLPPLAPPIEITPSLDDTTATQTRKAHISKSLRKEVWEKSCGKSYNHKCLVPWCTTTMTPFDFEVGHDLPESRGGTLALSNLHAICPGCNRSMGDRYTIAEWSRLSARPRCCYLGILVCGV